MTTAVIYSNGSQECDRIAQLLNALPNVETFHRYELDEHFTKQQFEMEFGGDAPYPQIQIDNQHIGSMKEALQYMQKKEMLDKQRHTM